MVVNQKLEDVGQTVFTEKELSNLQAEADDHSIYPEDLVNQTDIQNELKNLTFNDDNKENSKESRKNMNKEIQDKIVVKNQYPVSFIETFHTLSNGEPF